MTPESAIISLSTLDEERFGMKSAKTAVIRGGNIPEVMRFCAEHKVEFLITRCPTGDLEAVREMEKLGFLLMDTLLYFARDLVKTQVPGYACGNTTRLAREDDARAVKIVAKKAFGDYPGHYHADPQLPREKCDEVYSDWAYRACTSRNADEGVIVAEQDGRIIGFGTMKKNSEAEGEGGLFGVDPSYRGRGIYRSIMVGCLKWCVERKLERMLISTQVTNLASQKLWIRLGFEPSHSYYTFHKWFGPLRDGGSRQP